MAIISVQWIHRRLTRNPLLPKYNCGLDPSRTEANERDVWVDCDMWVKGYTLVVVATIDLLENDVNRRWKKSLQNRIVSPGRVKHIGQLSKIEKSLQQTWHFSL